MVSDSDAPGMNLSSRSKAAAAAMVGGERRKLEETRLSETYTKAEIRAEKERRRKANRAKKAKKKYGTNDKGEKMLAKEIEDNGSEVDQLEMDAEVTEQDVEMDEEFKRARKGV